MGGHVILRMPKLVTEMTEGLLARWLVQDGVEIVAGAPIYEVETDNLENEITAPVSGRVRLIATAGQVYAVGEPLAEIMVTREARVDTLQSERPTALVTAPFRGPGVEQLRSVIDLVIDPWIEHEPLRLYDEQGLAARIEQEGASIVICEGDKVGGPVFELPLLAIGSARGDPTNVDIDGATAAGIPVLHAPGRNADAVAEMTVALLLAVTRQLVPADRDVRNGEIYRDGTIPYQRFRAWQVVGRTAGVIGLGAVGRATRWRLEGLGMRVIAADPYVPDATHSLEDLLAEADVVSMHAAITPKAMSMIDRKAIEQMRDGAIFLNTARAALHDLDALGDALASGKLAGAGLDHFEGELLDPSHPITKLPNVVLTPHIGGATYDTEANHTAMLADDLIRILSGRRPQRIANPEVLS